MKKGYIQTKILLKRCDRKICFCFTDVKTPFYVLLFSHFGPNLTHI